MSLKELRRRISGIKSTQKITAAMRMVASVKLRRLQDRIHFGNDFLARLNAVGQSLGQIHHDTDHSSPWQSSEGNYDLVIIFGAEKGLCGSFHSNLIRQANLIIEKKPSAKLLIFGNKAMDTLKVHQAKLLPIHVATAKPNLQTFAGLVKAIEPLKIQREIASVFTVGATFHSMLSQEFYHKMLCPFNFDDSPTHDTAIFEPSADIFLPYFFTQYLSAQLHQAWLETLASEMASRMIAMDNATRNAKEMITDLSLIYNRTRQAKITTELIEIIAGAQ